jgi:hypothetical protein
VIIVLARCGYRIIPGHPLKTLEFIDETGTTVQVAVSPEASAGLAKDLAGIEVARDMPNGNGNGHRG